MRELTALENQAQNDFYEWRKTRVTPDSYSAWMAAATKYMYEPPPIAVVQYDDGECRWVGGICIAKYCRTHSDIAKTEKEKSISVDAQTVP